MTATRGCMKSSAPGPNPSRESRVASHESFMIVIPNAVRNLSGVLLLVAIGCARTETPAPPSNATGTPADPPAAIAPLVGDYAQGTDSISVREVGGRLEAIGWKDTTQRAALEAANVGDSIVFEGKTWRRIALGPS